MKLKGHRAQSSGRSKSGNRPAARAAAAAIKGRTALAGLLGREIRRGLAQIPAQKIPLLYRELSKVGRRVRNVIVEAANQPEGPVEWLKGSGLRGIQTGDERRKLDAAVERARHRGQGAIMEILSRPDMLTGEEFAALASTSRETVNRWRAARRVLGLEGNTRGVRYPAWQIDDNGALLKDLPSFLQAVGDGWASYRWLTSKLPEFGGITGLDLVRSGRTAELVAAAQHFGETF